MPETAAVNHTSLYNDSPCGLLTLRQGKIVYINNTLLNWLQLDISEILSREFTNFLDKGHRLYYQLFVQPMLNLHKDVKEIDFTIRTPHISFPCLFSASSTTYESDELVHCALFKVADRKKYESELLRKKVEAEAEKQVKTQALHEIAFDQAHLARAPLANMLGLISLIETMEISEEVRNLLGLLLTSTEHLDTQIKDIVRKTNPEWRNPAK